MSNHRSLREYQAIGDTLISGYLFEAQRPTPKRSPVILVIKYKFHKHEPMMFLYLTLMAFLGLMRTRNIKHGDDEASLQRVPPGFLLGAVRVTAI